MSNLVIVAIPRAEDPVWKYSSEKVPHTTLLFLGENTHKANEIAAFLEHAVKILDRGPFGLTVDHRGVLGDDKADVLFFRDDWATKEVARFRSQLLKNNDIRNAYDSATQFDGWTPHLTMGYPSSPAKKDDRDYPGFHWVEFDRIALWTGDYLGPEFRLEYDYHDQPLEVMMTAEEAVAQVLSHHGVKGMKWGVRKSGKPRGAIAGTIRGNDKKGRSRFNPDFQKEQGRTTGTDALNTLLGVVVPVYAPATVGSQVRLVRKGVRSVKDGKPARQDRRFEARASGTNAIIKVHNNAVPDLNKGQKAINARYKGVNMTDPKNAAKQRKYMQETTDMMAKTYQKHANAIKSPSGKLQYDVERHGDNIKIVSRKVKHAEGETGDVSVTFKLVYGDNGQVVGLKLDEMAQGEEFVDYLMHYGVKGMKWGVTRSTVKVTSSQGTTVTGKAKAKTTGGTGQKATADALKAAGHKQKLKKSGTAALSNKELQELRERLQLENQVKDLVTPKGKKFVLKKLGSQVDQGVNRELQDYIKKRKGA